MNIFNLSLKQCPIIAILRGITPDNCIEISQILYDSGIRIIEVPLNSPEPYKSIELLRKHFNSEVIIGAGTVLEERQVINVYNSGGQIIIAPNVSVNVGIQAKKLNMLWLPGVYTPTEGFLALQHQADGLKMFPSENITPNMINAWRSVFPKGTKLIPVGGINYHNIESFLTCSDAVGIGGGLFKVGDKAEVVSERVSLIMKNVNIVK